MVEVVADRTERTSSHALIRSQRRETNKLVFDQQRSIYQDEYDKFVTNNQPLVDAFNDHHQVKVQIDSLQAQKHEEATLFIARVETMLSDKDFILSQIENLKQAKQRSWLISRLDQQFRRGPMRWFADKLFYPEDFMQQQLSKLEALLKRITDQHQDEQLENDNKLSLLNDQKNRLGDEIYKPECEWIMLGDETRLINYVIDHPERREDLFTRFLKVHSAIDERTLQEMYIKYSQLFNLVKTQKDPRVPYNAKPKNVGQQIKTTVDPSEQILQNDPNEAEEFGPNNLYVVLGVNTEPTLVPSLEVLKKELKVTLNRADEIWGVLSWIAESLEEDKTRTIINSRYKETVIDGVFKNWRKIRIGRKERLIFLITPEGQIWFRYGDHQEVVASKRKIKGGRR